MILLLFNGQKLAVWLWSYSKLFPWGGVWGLDGLSSLTIPIWGLFCSDAEENSTFLRSAFGGFTWIWGIVCGAIQRKVGWSSGRASRSPVGTQALPSALRSNPAVIQGVFSRSLPRCASAPPPANQGCGNEWEGKEGRKGGKQGGLGDFSLLQCFWGYNLRCEGFIFIIITKSNLNALFKMTTFAPISIE